MMFIDIGNSYIKVAEFAGGSWSLKLRVAHSQLDEAIHWMLMLTKTGTRFLASSVRNSITENLNRELGQYIRFVSVLDFPVDRINYNTLQTLGSDRVLACLGAYSLSHGKSVIVVDAGTATTIDYMDKKGVFQGGVIAPGIGSMESGLFQHAPELPKVDRMRPAMWPPKSTNEALQWGLTGSYQSLIRDHIHRFLSDDASAEIWFSGGDADVLMNLDGIKSKYHPNLVFEGLRSMHLSQFRGSKP
jgi:type III pantothenate kinase